MTPNYSEHKKTNLTVKSYKADLYNLIKWSNTWCPIFNTSKCKDNKKFQNAMKTENNNMVLTETAQEKNVCVVVFQII